MNELKRVQEQIKLLEQKEQPVKRLLLSFVEWVNSSSWAYTEDLIQQFLKELKEREQELLPKQKYKQGELL